MHKMVQQHVCRWHGALAHLLDQAACKLLPCKLDKLGIDLCTPWLCGHRARAACPSMTALLMCMQAAGLGSIGISTQMAEVLMLLLAVEAACRMWTNAGVLVLWRVWSVRVCGGWKRPLHPPCMCMSTHACWKGAVGPQAGTTYAVGSGMAWYCAACFVVWWA